MLNFFRCFEYVLISFYYFWSILERKKLFFQKRFWGYVIADTFTINFRGIFTCNYKHININLSNQLSLIQSNINNQLFEHFFRYFWIVVSRSTQQVEVVWLMPERKYPAENQHDFRLNQFFCLFVRLYNFFSFFCVRLYNLFVYHSHSWTPGGGEGRGEKG